MKKLAVIGKGTAGVLALSHFYSENLKLELYYDSKIHPQPVGEGSTLDFPIALKDNLMFEHSDLIHIDGTFKLGIYKKGWSEGEAYTHHFPPPSVSYHFNAAKLQDYILDKVSDKVKIIDKNVEHSDIDADFIIDCSGKPTSYEDFYISDAIPVNSAYVTQCYWEYPRFNHTLTIARPYGWVFGIPLRNRCSIGYMFNSEINSIEDIKDDVINVFEEFNLIPSDKTNTLNFTNYYRKNNFENRVCYSGNASFFLEPLEATSIGTIDHIHRMAYDIWFSNFSPQVLNAEYIKNLKEIENMIALHYLSGSIYDTKFWNMAKDKAEKNITEAVRNRDFVYIYENSKEYKKHINKKEYGSWTTKSFNENLKNLNLYKKIDMMIKK
jgi:hypothetical protein